jgi:hypothetical protein
MTTGKLVYGSIEQQAREKRERENRKIKERNANASYFSIYDVNGNVREDGRARMIEQYGFSSQ